MRRFRRWVRAWYITLREQMDPERRRILRGTFDPDDFVEVQRPGGGDTNAQ